MITGRQVDDWIISVPNDRMAMVSVSVWRVMIVMSTMIAMTMMRHSVVRVVDVSGTIRLQIIAGRPLLGCFFLVGRGRLRRHVSPRHHTQCHQANKDLFIFKGFFIKSERKLQVRRKFHYQSFCHVSINELQLLEFDWSCSRFRIHLYLQQLSTRAHFLPETYETFTGVPGCSLFHRFNRRYSKRRAQ